MTYSDPPGTVTSGHAALKTAIRRNGGSTWEVWDRREKKVLASASSVELAVWDQIRHEIGLARSTDLQRLAATYPALTSRIKRAGLMFARRLCGPVDWDDPNVYRVRSQTHSDQEYRVHIDPADLTRWTCKVVAGALTGHREHHTCPDIAHDAPAIEGQGKRCKHMMLAALHRAWVYRPWVKQQNEYRAARAAHYGDGTEPDPQDLVKFADFVRDHRRLPMNATALR